MLPCLLLSGLATGCASNVTLGTPTIPEPLLEPIRMTVGVRMPANFEHFVHEEKVYGREEWTIDLGRSNAALFEQLFAYMFSDVVLLGPDDDPQLVPFDALIEPSIDAFEFSTPDAAYGKSQTTTMGGSSALQSAAVLAMRDAAALMIMKFDDVTRISTLAGGAAPTPPAPPAPPPAEQLIENSAESGSEEIAAEGSTDE